MISAAQSRFIRLHRDHFVATWQALFGGAQLRATSDRGLTATISQRELDDLMARGLLTSGHGFMFALTEAGQACQ